MANADKEGSGICRDNTSSLRVSGVAIVGKEAGLRNEILKRQWQSQGLTPHVAPAAKCVAHGQSEKCLAADAH